MVDEEPQQSWLFIVLGIYRLDEIFSDLNFDPNQMAGPFHEIFESALNSHAAIGVRKSQTEKNPLAQSCPKAFKRERDESS